MDNHEGGRTTSDNEREIERTADNQKGDEEEEEGREQKEKKITKEKE